MTSVFPESKYSHLREGYISKKFIFPDPQHTMDEIGDIHPKSPAEENFLHLGLNHPVHNAYILLLSIGVSSAQFNTGLILDESCASLSVQSMVR